MKIYALYSCAPSRNIVAYYKDKKTAHKELDSRFKEISYRLGHTNLKYTNDDSFSFILGWEEHKVTWGILTIDVIE
jgi:hypothetical protein